LNISSRKQEQTQMKHIGDCLLYERFPLAFRAKC
jgi:hypothetical protein